MAYFQPNVPNLQRKVEKNCQICGKEFSMFRYEHQCKRCLRAVCDGCANKKIAVYKIDFVKVLHRTCKICEEERLEIEEYISANGLSFGKMSHLGNKWLSRVERKSINPSIDNLKYKKFTKEVFNRMWNSYNYSMREFIGLLTFQFEQSEIYQQVNDVLVTVISIAPEEDIESIAYLVMFLLCFCSPDKVAILILFLLGMKATVANEQGLIQAVLRAVGIDESIKQKMKDYIKDKSRRYIHAFSINSLSVKTTRMIVEKIITRKKIDELYIYFGLTVELMKDTIINKKDNSSFCDIMLVRSCHFDTLNNKYKQACIKTIDFMHKKESEALNLSLNKDIQNSISKDDPLVASFSEGIRGNRQPFNFNRLQEEQQIEPINFRKREIKQNSFVVEDSFSMMSMIDEMNQKEGNEILNLMREVNSKSPNSSLEIKSQLTSSTKNKAGNDCSSCNAANATIDKLLKEIQQLKLEKEKFTLEYKKENDQLKQRIASKTQNLKQQSNNNFEKIQYESQIRKLTLSLNEYQQKEKEYQSNAIKLEQYKKLIKKHEMDQRTSKQQLEQANINIKMLKNKLQSQSILPQTKPETSDSSKINQILKQSLLQKNKEIEQLSKKNKVIDYQLEQLSKERVHDKEKMELKEKIAKQQRERENILIKMKELSNLLMEEESQKLSLSEQNFQLKEMLRKYNISFNKT